MYPAQVSGDPALRSDATSQERPNTALHNLLGTGKRAEASERGSIRLVVLLDPTSGRDETARQLAGAGDWQVLALDSSQAHTLGPAVEELAAAIHTSDKAAQVELLAVVLEAVHPLSQSANPPTALTTLRAEQLLVWLENRLGLTFVETVLYTADREALAQARQDWDFARRSGRHQLAKFSATLQRDPVSQSDLALAQLLNYLVWPLPVVSEDGEELPF